MIQIYAASEYWIWSYADLIYRIFVCKVTFTEKNYWADDSYYSDLEITIYGQ